VEHLPAQAEPIDPANQAEGQRALLAGLAAELGELQLCAGQLGLGEGSDAVRIDVLVRDDNGRLWLVAEVDGRPASTAIMALALFDIARRERAVLTHLAGAREISATHVALVAERFDSQTLDWLAAFAAVPLSLFEWRTISREKRTDRLLVALSASGGEALAPPTLDEFLAGLDDGARELVARLAKLDPELELGIGRAELRFAIEGVAVCRLQKQGERLRGAIAGGESIELDRPQAARDFLDRTLAEIAPRIGLAGSAHATLEAALGNDPARPILSSEELAAFRD
jgi:hypothetical protein